MSALTWHNYSPEKLLTERFHISTNFHGEQREIIEQLVQGQRVLAIQRTGWGKSLCYQMASLYYPHLTIVFSPLKALMRDQCRRCNIAYSIPAAIISSDFTGEQNKVTLEKVVAGQFKILFIAPERLSNALWQSYVAQLRISMIVIDEAHCISTWGHDFRPHYRRIVRLLNTTMRTGVINCARISSRDLWPTGTKWFVQPMLWVWASTSPIFVLLFIITYRPRPFTIIKKWAEPGVMVKEHGAFYSMIQLTLLFKSILYVPRNLKSTIMQQFYRVFG